MFTGIVTHRGLLVEVEDRPGGLRRLVVRPEPDLLGVRLGASVALDGVCLTVAAQLPAGLAFDVIPETLRKTTLGGRKAGERVNLEASLRVGDEVGGHWVQGHVEGTGEVVAAERRGDEIHLAIRVPAELHAGVIPKGSVALDGVSLTVGEVWQEPADLAPGAGRFRVYLIPHTLAVTGFGEARVGTRVNVEPDMLGRWVEHHVRQVLGRHGGGTAADTAAGTAAGAPPFAPRPGGER